MFLIIGRLHLRTIGAFVAFWGRAKQFASLIGAQYFAMAVATVQSTIFEGYLPLFCMSRAAVAYCNYIAHGEIGEKMRLCAVMGSLNQVVLCFYFGHIIRNFA